MRAKIPWKVREMKEMTRTRCFRLSVSQELSVVGDRFAAYRVMHTLLHGPV